MGSGCTVISLGEACRLGLAIDERDVVEIRSFGNASVRTLGTAEIALKVDGVLSELKAHVVPDGLTDVPVLVGRTYTDQLQILLIKDSNELKILRQEPLAKQDPPSTAKIVLRLARQ